ARAQPSTSSTLTPHPHPSALGGEYRISVAQIANLRYRRLQIGRALAVFRRPGQGVVLQDGILRYSRLAVCATNTTEALNRYGGERVPVGPARGILHVPKLLRGYTNMMARIHRPE